MKFIKKYEVAFYVISVLLVTSFIVFIAYLQRNINLSILCVLVPSFVAFVLTYLKKGKSGLYNLFIAQTKKKIAFKWILLSVFILPLLVIIANLIYHDLDFSQIKFRDSQIIPQVIIITVIALGEEYGWRGYLLPRLIEKMNLLNASILSGLIWGFWHYPASLIWTAVPLQMEFKVFIFWVILVSILISWVYYHTRSVLTSIILHMSANAAFHYLYLLPEFTGNMTVFYLFLSVLSSLVLVILILDRKAFWKEVKKYNFS